MLFYSTYFKVLAAFIIAITANATTSAQQSTEPSNITVEHFATLPIKAVKLSPSGNKLAYLAPKAGKYHLIIQNLDGTDPLVIPTDERTDYHDIHWKSDDTLIFKLVAALNRTWYVRRGLETRLVSFSLSERKFRWLGKNNTVKGLYGTEVNTVVSMSETIVDLLTNDPEHILMEFNNARSGPVVVKVNVKSGLKKSVKEAATGITEWSADPNHDIRFGWGLYYDKKLSLRYKLSSGKWEYFDDSPWVEKYDALYPAPEPDTLYVLGPTPSGYDGIYQMKLPSGELGAPVFEYPNHDVYGIALHPDGSNMPVGYVYTDRYQEIAYFDEDLNFLQKGLNHIFPKTQNLIADKAIHHDSYIIKVRSDTNAGDYYLYDRSQKKLSFLMSAYPNIDEAHMSQTSEVSIPTSSGRELKTYITSPKGKDGPLPSIIIPRNFTYGGQSDAHWNYITQFFTSRGWQVIRPNTAGGGGYGKSFLQAGVKERSGVMQDDLAMVTNWLIENHKTYPNKVCILGFNYGGYAAIYGAIKTPELYSCAVSIDGQLDLTTGWQRDRYYIGGPDFVNSIADDTDAKSISPLHQASLINTPILLIATRENSRVEYTQSQNMDKALSKHNMQHTYLQIEDTDQHFLSETSRKTLLNETERFLKQYLD